MSTLDFRFRGLGAGGFGSTYTNFTITSTVPIRDHVRHQEDMQRTLTEDLDCSMATDLDPPYCCSTRRRCGNDHLVLSHLVGRKVQRVQ